jgi:replicative DNA helicase
LGIYGHTAESKFIPQQYLEASKEQRWELLRGLMDTDGTAGNKQGTPSYCTISRRLAKDVVRLVRSLGGVAKIGKPQKKHFKYKGEMRTGQPAYIIVVRVPDPTRVFFLKRKLALVKPRKHDMRLKFTHIKPVGEKEAVCISVSHPSKLYITDDYIVTHNTTLGMNIMDHMVAKYGEDGLIVCLEMTQARLARKHVALLTSFEDIMTEPGTPESRLQLEKLKLAAQQARVILQQREGDLYFAYPMQWQDDPDSVFKMIKDCIRRYGIKWVMFDNLQKFCDESLGRNMSHRTIILSQMSKKFASLAKDYKIKLIRILQPKRIEKGATISTNDVDGSSQIAKDCDGMITAWRAVVGEMKKSEWETQNEGFEESAMSFEPVMKITVGLSRYSPGGTTKLWYDGARSQVRSIPKDQKNGMNQQKNFNGIIMESGVTVPVVVEDSAPTTVPTEGDITI